MATPITNPFTQFELTPEEFIAGTTFNANQLMFLQNLRADEATKRLVLKYDPNNHQVYLQQEAENTGWLNCLNYILECHQSAMEVIKTGVNNNNLESVSDG